MNSRMESLLDLLDAMFDYRARTLDSATIYALAAFVWLIVVSIIAFSAAYHQITSAQGLAP